MKKIILLFGLLLVTVLGMAQAPSNYTNINGRYRWIAGMFDSTFHIPKGTTPSLRTGGSTNPGALFYKTGDSSLQVYTGSQWLRMLKVGDTTSMLLPYLRKVDTTAMLSPYARTVNVRAIIADSLGGLQRLKALNAAGAAFYSSSGTKVAEWGLGGGANFDFHGFAGYDINRAGSYTVRSFTDKNYVDSAISASPSGTVTSVATNTGTGITGGTITTSGTIAADTLLLSTRAWRQKGIDSVAALVNSNVSGTSGYLSKFNASNTINNSGIYQFSPYVLGLGTATNPNYSETTGFVLNNDTTSSFIQFNVRDTSRLAISGNATRASVLAGTGLPLVLGGHSALEFWVTSPTPKMYIDNQGRTGIGTSSPTQKLQVNGRVKIDSIDNATTDTDRFLVSDGGVIKYRTGAELLSDIGGASSASISGTTNYIPKFTSSSAIGNSNLQTDASGNLGLGVTPSAWNTVGPVLQVNRAALYGYQNGAALSANYRYESGSIYINSDFATLYLQTSGQHQWFNAPSGTAGNAISFTQAMTLDASGNLGIGTTSPAQGTLQVHGITAAMNAGGDGTLGTAIIFGNPSFPATQNHRIRTSTSSLANLNLLQIEVSNGTTGQYNNNQLVLRGDGNVGIGTTSLGSWAKLQVAGNAAITGNGYYFSNDLVGGSTPAYLEYNYGTSELTLGSYGASANGYIKFTTGGSSERMRITSSGNVGIGTTAPNSKLHVAGSFTTPHVTKSADYTLDATDYTVGFSCAANRTATLPDATTCAGRIYVIYQYNTTNATYGVIIDGNGAQTINGSATYSLVGYCEYSSVMIQSDGNNWVVISDALQTGCL